MSMISFLEPVILEPVPDSPGPRHPAAASRLVSVVTLPFARSFPMYCVSAPLSSHEGNTHMHPNKLSMIWGSTMGIRWTRTITFCPISVTPGCETLGRLLSELVFNILNEGIAGCRGTHMQSSYLGGLLNCESSLGNVVKLYFKIQNKTQSIQGEMKVFSTH